MEPFEVRVREWAWATHECLSRVATDPRCPEDIRREAHRWQVECEHVGDPYPGTAWWPNLSEDLP